MSQRATPDGLPGFTESAAPVPPPPGSPEAFDPPTKNKSTVASIDRAVVAQQQQAHGVAVKNAKSWSHIVAGA